MIGPGSEVVTTSPSTFTSLAVTVSVKGSSLPITAVPEWDFTIARSTFGSTATGSLLSLLVRSGSGVWEVTVATLVTDG